MTRRIALITTLFTLALVAPAMAQGNPFGPLPQAPPEETPTPTPANAHQDDSTGSKTLFIIGGALVVAFLGMGWFIARDARRGLGESARLDPGLRSEGPHKHKRQAKARARARGRAQKAARRRNR